MEPLIVLVVVTLVLWAAGAAGVHRLRPWPITLRGGLAAMFVLTGVAHFVGMRADLIAMVPAGVPEPALVVTVTGVLELAGAVGLLVRRTAPWAAAGLAVLLVAMFPANVYATLEGLSMALAPRAFMQLVFLAAALAVVAGVRREADDRRRVRAPAVMPRRPVIAPKVRHRAGRS